MIGASSRSGGVVFGVLALVAGGCGAPTAPSVTVTLAQVSMAPSSVVAGGASEATVILSGPAPGGGVRVAIASSDGAAAVPASIVVDAGTTSAVFPVQTRVVAADTSVTITVTVEAETRAATLRVMAPVARPATFDALQIEPTTLRAGQSARGTVFLTSAAPAGGFTVNLKSSNSVATVLASVSIPPGAVSAMFNVTTAAVTLDTLLEITANVGDVTRTVALRVTP
jgi:hypothetical protein